MSKTRYVKDSYVKTSHVLGFVFIVYKFTPRTVFGSRPVPGVVSARGNMLKGRIPTPPISCKPAERMLYE
jgi:hypothetical protein